MGFLYIIWMHCSIMICYEEKKSESYWLHHDTAGENRNMCGCALHFIAIVALHYKHHVMMSLYTCCGDAFGCSGGGGFFLCLEICYFGLLRVNMLICLIFLTAWMEEKGRFFFGNCFYGFACTGGTRAYFFNLWLLLWLLCRGRGASWQYEENVSVTASWVWWVLIWWGWFEEMWYDRSNVSFGFMVEICRKDAYFLLC